MSRKKKKPTQPAPDAKPSEPTVSAPEAVPVAIIADTGWRRWVPWAIFGLFLVIMAMGLVLEPRLLISDEPASGLDVTLQAETLDLLRKLFRKQGTSILLITHDMGVAASMDQQVGFYMRGV